MNYYIKSNNLNKQLKINDLNLKNKFNQQKENILNFNYKFKI